MNNVKREVDLHFLQHYRHDLMNELQIILGFLQMNNEEQVNNKLNEVLTQLECERKLLALYMPKFAYWILMFNHMNSEFNLKYNINIETPLKKFDEQLTNDCKQFFDIVYKYVDIAKTHSFTVSLKPSSKDIFKVSFEINHLLQDKEFQAICHNKLQVRNLKFEHKEQPICEWTYR